jgi:glycosyltransferase involved in cell wall biosynthesis
MIDLPAWSSYKAIELLLLMLFVAINASWISLLIVSFRPYFCIPIICYTDKKKTKTKKIMYVSDNNTINNASAASAAYRNNNNAHYPFISIIIPARNEQDNIESCLLSLLSQSYPNFEIIAVDDNSTDDTLKIMKEVKNATEPKSMVKIISLTDKPKDWNGKAWASQQGYLQSHGSILLFTDADTFYSNKDTILLTVLYMQKENLDVLTGIPLIKLLDFWSKITMPLWDNFSIILGLNPGAVNDPKSNVAYLMGSFFIIHRNVLEDIGAFRPVRQVIHEDAALGAHIKKAGYNMKIVGIDSMVSALWPRDVQTLWHCIRRTFAPMSNLKLIINLLALFFMALFPFLILPYDTLLWFSSSHVALQQQQQQQLFNNPVAMITSSSSSSSSSSILPLFANDDFMISYLLLFLNISSCLIVIIATAIKGARKHRITSAYSLLVWLGAIFLMTAYIRNAFPFMISPQTKSVLWKGRKLIL